MVSLACAQWAFRCDATNAACMVARTNAAQSSLPRSAHRTDGLTVLGVPIRPAAYQNATVTNRATKVIGLIDTMRNLRRLPLQ
jgi:hypothetical protein